jgi:DNA-binding MarR family transcriptional regulator
MKPIQRILHLKQDDYYIKHLTIINTLLPTYLTDKEIEVLAAFMSLDKNLIEDDMFNTVARKKVMTKLNLSPGGLGNHLKSMINKKVLDRNEITNKITIKTFLLPQEPAQGYQIKILKK